MAHLYSDSRVLPDTIRRALTFFYRSRFTRNYSSRYIRRALVLLHEAAEHGNGSAMSFLGLAYGEAWGVPQDLQKAVYWLQQAATTGHRLARYNLAVAYDNGLGVPRNRVQAWLLFRGLAAEGYRDAQFEAAHRLFYGEGVVQNYAQARYWARQAARQGHSEAMQLLGTCLLRGLGGPTHLAAAQRWLKRAVAGGSCLALQRLAEAWQHPTNTVRPEERICYLQQLLEARSKAVATQALYTLGCVGLQYPHLLPARRANVTEYFRWAARFKHQGAALKFAQLQGEEF
ncbi:TPR repeat protein [Hymenobacter luteus]|uniref:TPR repeat protein n=2 Tax=Hymenobacter TaxID=89966 RepID=A0A7W9WCG2_9BACT|nr:MULTISPECIES: tetratricopeptide repeat protein [Hymenobacter]MBB4602225.1 TPR repeat protein [Hymenobacter latericoloratus]MBB6059346.1 TPR repeat protein [Hymenobacter luteus]